MFTGIIPITGTIVRVQNARRGRFITVKTDPKIVRRVPEGGSVSVEGVCLTALGRRAAPRVPPRRGTSPRPTKDGGSLTFELMDSTLKRTTLGVRKVGDRVNVEPAMLVGQPIGGHFISGHVDGVGIVRKIATRWHTRQNFASQNLGGQARYLVINIPHEFHRYLVPQGSVVVNGVSLTIVEVGRGWFSVALTSYTLAHTNLSDLKVSDKVNIEVDMLAKYLEKFLTQYALRHRGRKL